MTSLLAFSYLLLSKIRYNGGFLVMCIPRSESHDEDIEALLCGIESNNRRLGLKLVPTQFVNLLISAFNTQYWFFQIIIYYLVPFGIYWIDIGRLLVHQINFEELLELDDGSHCLRHYGNIIGLTSFPQPKSTSPFTILLG